MFKLDIKSRKSIYEQVIDNLKELIVSGKLKEGDKLPSVRELSKTITVNPNTVQKAYRELERQGYVYTTSGVGTFVAGMSNIQISEKDLDHAREALDEAFRNLMLLGMSYTEAKDFALEVIEERRKSDD